MHTHLSETKVLIVNWLQARLWVLLKAVQQKLILHIRFVLYFIDI